MAGRVPGICDPALAPGAPEWVQLFPDGPINGRDGRSWELPDPAAPVAAFKAGGIDLPVDFGHANDNPDARLKGPVPAAGWITQLRAEAGLWGRGAWTATAAEMIGNRAYRYLVRLLHGAGRVPVSAIGGAAVERTRPPHAPPHGAGGTLCDRPGRSDGGPVPPGFWRR